MLISTLETFFVPVSYIKDLSENLDDFIEKAEFDSEKMRLVVEKVYDSETKLVVRFTPDGKGTAYIYKGSQNHWHRMFDFELEKEEYLKFLEKFLEKARAER